MKISYPPLGKKIEFGDAKVFSLVIENSKLFYDFCKDLYQQSCGEDGSTILYQNDILPFEKHTLVFYDYLNIQNNTAKISNLIYKAVEKEINRGDYIANLAEINSLIIKLNEKIIHEIDLPISCSEEFTVDKYIKLSNFFTTPSTSLCEDLLNHIELLSKIKKIKLIVFVNAFLFLSLQDISNILNDLKYQDVFVLFVNPFQKYKLQNVPGFIIDEDLCVI